MKLPGITLLLIPFLLVACSPPKPMGFFNVEEVKNCMEVSERIDIDAYMDELSASYTDQFMVDSILPHLYDPYDLRGNQLIDLAFENKGLPPLPERLPKAKMMRCMWEGILPFEDCHDSPNDSLCKLRKQLKEYVPVNLKLGGTVHMGLFQITIAEMHETAYQTPEELHLLLTMDYIFRNGKDD